MTSDYSEPAPECLTFRAAFKDYWNEWAGLLQWVELVDQHERTLVFETKTIITGGTLVRSFGDRFKHLTLTNPELVDLAKIEELDQLAQAANAAWHARELTPSMIVALAASARSLIDASEQIVSRN